MSQVTAVALLSSPTRLQLTYTDGNRGPFVATYRPDAVLFVPYDRHYDHGPVKVDKHVIVKAIQTAVLQPARWFAYPGGQDRIGGGGV